MEVASTVVKWYRIGFSIRGTSHIGAGLPLQDSLRRWPKGNRPAALAAMTVLDGHGNKKHFRSALGATIGADVATSTLSRWAKKLKDSTLTENVAAVVSKKVAEEVHCSWVDRVSQHAACEPFELRSLSRLSDKEQKLLAVAPQVAYGATYLSAIATERWGLLQRIGDGVIAVCDEEGNVTLPLGESEKSSQSTASLCFPNAVEQLQTHFIDFSLYSPTACIVLATDGYPDAAGGVNRFKERVVLFAETLKRLGPQEFAVWFRTHLDRVSEHLFDDSTIAFLVRSDWEPEGESHA